MATLRATALYPSNGHKLRLAASTDAEFTSPTYGALVTSQNGVVHMEVDGLTADTLYYLATEINGVLGIDDATSVRTFPEAAASFRCAFASCAVTGSNHVVFDAIRTMDPANLFFMHLGDFHYQDIAADSVPVRMAAYRSVFSSPRQSQFYRSVRTFSIWDDHDFCGDNSNGDAAGKASAITAFKRRVPLPPLGLDGEFDPICYAWTVGRVRFIVTDLRSARDPHNDPNGASKTMLGAAQKAWFFDELAAAAGTDQMVIWFSSCPWIGTESDMWAAYASERAEIADEIKALGLSNRMGIISGDRHFIAIDDGTLGDFATGGGAAMPTFIAAPLDQTTSGADDDFGYSEGCFYDSAVGGQFGTMDISDSGGSTIDITWKGWRTASKTDATLTELVSFAWQATMPA